MRVKLLNHALGDRLEQGMKVDYEYLVQQAAAICVDKLDSPTEKGMKNAIDSGHLSIIEHLPLTFLVEDVSRALTHQLVRHRIASYSQQSQRYAKVNTNEDWYVIPDSIKNCNYFNGNKPTIGDYNIQYSIKNEYEDIMNKIASFYNKLCNLRIPNEDARMVLPNACFTSIMITMNARAFVEAAEKRICKKAQWEIREMFCKMRELIKDIYPTVYEMTKPPCLKEGCTEKRPCGEPYA